MSLNENLIPLEAYLLLRSGRVSFELVQKAVMASVPILAAVGAQFFLAVDSLMAHPGFRGATRSSINDPSNALPRLPTLCTNVSQEKSPTREQRIATPISVARTAELLYRSA